MVVKRVFIICSILLCLLSLPGFADSWPRFISPEVQWLLNTNYLSSNGCPQGEVRFVSQTPIKMNLNCDGYCSPEWEWKLRSDGLCHKMADLDFIDYQINHLPAQNDWNYSVVTASYGSKVSGRAYFEYVLTTPPGELWYCTYMEKQKWISCANDY